MECNTCTNPRDIDTPLLTKLDFINKDKERDNNQLYVNLEEEIQYNPVFFFTDLDSSRISPDKYNLFVTVKSLDNSDYMIPPALIAAKRATRYHALGHLDWTVATYQIVSEIVTTSSKHEQTIDRDIDNLFTEIKNYDVNNESEELINLAKEAINSLTERENENVDEWAHNLANDVSGAND